VCLCLPAIVFTLRVIIVVKITTSRGWECLTPACASLLEHKGTGLGLLKFTFNADNFLRRLSWSICSHFVANPCWNVRRRRKSQKISKNPYFGGSRSFKVIDVDTNKSFSLLLVTISSMLQKPSLFLQLLYRNFLILHLPLAMHMLPCLKI